ncbi:hypothetical protein EDB89DRAFT_1388549 [Lactarius sanguifluus]|nr:hypothetical protein EDB89DRAFT_1388549 [Lactarius sanguifluus]
MSIGSTDGAAHGFSIRPRKATRRRELECDCRCRYRLQRAKELQTTRSETHYSYETRVVLCKGPRVVSKPKLGRVPPRLFHLAFHLAFPKTMSLSVAVPLILYRLHYLNLVSTLSGAVSTSDPVLARLGNQIPVFLDDSSTWLRHAYSRKARSVWRSPKKSFCRSSARRRPLRVRAPQL